MSGAGDDAGLDAGRMDGGSDAGTADGGNADAGTIDAGGLADAGDGGCDCPKASWTLAGSQDAGGWFTNALALDDGRVLVTGGDFLGPNTIRFHPSTGTWSSGGTMSTEHVGAPVVHLQANRVLICGGFNYPNFIATAELLNTATNQWSPVPGSLVNARSGHKATRLLDNRVLVSGGDGPSGPVAFSELFDPSTNTFSESGQMVLPRSNHTATLLRDGRVLAAGGFTNVVTKAAEIYSPTTGSWTATGTMAGPGGIHKAVLLGSGKVLALSDSWGAEIFDPDGGTWTPTAPMLGAPAQVGGSKGLSVLPDGGVLVCGNYPPTRSCEVYNEVLNSWNQTDLMQRSRLGANLVLMTSGKVLAFGGFNFDPDAGGGETPVKESEIYW